MKSVIRSFFFAAVAASVLAFAPGADALDLDDFMEFGSCPLFH